MRKMRINLPTNDVKQLRFTHQADGGANFAATDRLDLLHDYRVYKKSLSIVAFFTQDDDSSPPEQHTVIGEGLLKLIGDNGEIIPMRMLYTPSSTGTVISLERTMKDMQRFNSHNKICNWSQNGGANRSVQWKDKDGEIVSSLQMEERNGLYYIKNPTLLPPPKPNIQSLSKIWPIPEETNADNESNEEGKKNKDEWISTSPDKTHSNEKGKTLTSKEPTGIGPSNEVEIIWAEKSEPTYSHLTKKTRKDEHRQLPIQVETVKEGEESKDSIAKEVRESSTHPTTEYLRHNATFMASIEDVEEDPAPTRTIPTHPPPAPQPPPDEDEEELTNQRKTPDGETTEATTPAQAIAPQAPTQRTSHRSRSWSSSLTKGIRQLEIWHQRMGHPSPTVLQRTQNELKEYHRSPMPVRSSIADTATRPSSTRQPEDQPSSTTHTSQEQCFIWTLDSSEGPPISQTSCETERTHRAQRSLKASKETQLTSALWMQQHGTCGSSR